MREKVGIKQHCLKKWGKSGGGSIDPIDRVLPRSYALFPILGCERTRLAVSQVDTCQQQAGVEV